METLKASGIEFTCLSSREVNTINYEKLISSKNLENNYNLSNLGFLVVRNVIPEEEINFAREKYFSLFKNGEYQKKENKWIHLRNHADAHGCNNHPSKSFLNSREFKKIVSSKRLVEISKKIFNSKDSFLCPRMIVRSFSCLSKVCSPAHRDKEYFVSPDPEKVATCWIPLGSVGSNNGQIIYLLDSHKKERYFNNLVKKKQVISNDLEKLSKFTGLQWFRPILGKGDVLFHSLQIVHAAFDSSSNLPRLSIDLRFSSSKENEDPRWENSWRGDDGL